YTIRFKLKNPQASFLAVMYGGSVQSAIMAPECVKADGSVTHPIGTGPFEFVSWEPHNYVKFKKFKDYWAKGLPHVDEVIVKMMPDVVARMTAMKTGDVDIMAQIPIEQVLDLFKKQPQGFKVATYQASPSYFVFNTSKPPFNDVRVRQAVAYGMNKKDIESAISHGHGQVINQPFHKESPWYCDVPDRTQDVAKAKQLLKEAGYPNGLEVTMTTQNKYLEYMMACELLQAQMADIGMKVKLDVVDFATYVAKCRNKEHQMGSLGLAPVPDPDAYLPMAMMKTGPYSGFSGNYDNPEVTRLISEGSRALKFEDRKKLYCQAISIIQEEVPYIYYSVMAGVYGIRDRVKGFEPSMTFFFNYDGGGMQYLWLEK
ncbi:MAG: ABC transporter substrate-binding protein, partial [Pseudomonadota bacterium]